MKKKFDTIKNDTSSYGDPLNFRHFYNFNHYLTNTIEKMHQIFHNREIISPIRIWKIPFDQKFYIVTVWFVHYLRPFWTKVFIWLIIRIECWREREHIHALDACRFRFRSLGVFFPSWSVNFIVTSHRWRTARTNVVGIVVLLMVLSWVQETIFLWWGRTTVASLGN